MHLMYIGTLVHVCWSALNYIYIHAETATYVHVLCTLTYKLGLMVCKFIVVIINSVCCNRQVWYANTSCYLFALYKLFFSVKVHELP